MSKSGREPALLSAAVVVAALGYFVDLYDLILFTIVRKPSLAALGLRGAEALSAGVLLLDAQLVGMLVGGFGWGILGDRLGRLRALFLSIVVYSVANLANAMVAGVPAYAFWRFVAGVGLAGELGAGITLVSELLPAARRGVGTMLVSMVGMFGALTAAGVGGLVDWRTSYVIGGVLGLVLLVLRIRVAESTLFERARHEGGNRGDLRLLFGDGARRKRLLGLVVVGSPIWFVVGVLVTFAPELATELGTRGAITTSDMVFWFYAGVVPGDLTSGLLSQKLRSRKRAVRAFLVLEAIAIAAFLAARGTDARVLLAVASFAGFATGYWAVLVTMAAEQFGTNLRATAATSVPNLVRATAVPVTAVFGVLRARVGMTTAAAIVGAAVVASAFLAMRTQRETFGEDLDFVER